MLIMMLSTAGSKLLDLTAFAQHAGISNILISQRVCLPLVSESSIAGWPVCRGGNTQLGLRPPQPPPSPPEYRITMRAFKEDGFQN